MGSKRNWQRSGCYSVNPGQKNKTMQSKAKLIFWDTIKNHKTSIKGKTERTRQTQTDWYTKTDKKVGEENYNAVTLSISKQNGYLKPHLFHSI